MLYLDYNATAPPWPEAQEAIEGAVFAPGNPSSLHWAGRAARRQIESAASDLAALVEAPPQGVVFTSGGTEANHLVLRGVAQARRRRQGAHVVVLSEIEHPSVMEAGVALARDGFCVRHAPVNETGALSLDRLDELLTDEVALVSVMLANNETGVLQPVKQVATMARERGIVVHTDAVQAVGKVPVSFAALGVHALTLSAHKFGGPRGMGALICDPGDPTVEVDPLWGGGGDSLRPGTAPVALAAGLAVAARLSASALANQDELCGLRNQLAKRLGRVAGAWFVGEGVSRLPNTLLVGFTGVAGQELVAALSDRGIMIGAGAACHGAEARPSRILCAMGVAPAKTLETVRISLGWQSSAKELDEAAGAIEACVSRLREESP